MDATSPSKRRVLATLDVNAPSPNSKLNLKQQHAKTDLSAPGFLKPFRDAAPVVLSPEQKKRALSAEISQEQPAKKACLDTAAVNSQPTSRVVEADMGDAEMAETDTSNNDNNNTRQRSVSPDACSVFDNSVVDTSQATAFTEPDLDGAVLIGVVPTIAIQIPMPPPQPRRIPTREESRQKAEILKLRLGLANYKLRTGQTDVPLDQLQMRPMPGAKRRSPLLPTSNPNTQTSASAPAQEWYRSAAQLTGGRDVPADDGNGDQQENSASQEEEEDEEEVEDAPRTHPHPSPEKNLLPRMPTSGLYTPQRSRFAEDDDKLTSSALRGGAVNGLLSLARG